MISSGWPGTDRTVRVTPAGTPAVWLFIAQPEKSTLEGVGLIFTL